MQTWWVLIRQYSPKLQSFLQLFVWEKIGKTENSVFITTLKELFTNFEYITFYSCPTERNIFYKRFISINPLWLEIIEKKGCTKSVRVIYIIYIIVLGRTDFVHPLFSIISSQSGFIEIDLLQKMLLLVEREKNVIYSKLVNNPFNAMV